MLLLKIRVKELKSGKLKIDKAKVKQDEKLDGKYLLSTSDQHLSSEDIALGYKQLSVSVRPSRRNTRAVRSPRVINTSSNLSFNVPENIKEILFQ
jgi:hypothetical protein